MSFLASTHEGNDEISFHHLQRDSYISLYRLPRLQGRNVPGDIREFLLVGERGKPEFLKTFKYQRPKSICCNGKSITNLIGYRAIGKMEEVGSSEVL